LEEEARRAAELQKEKIELRKAEEEETGQKKRGRKPKEPLGEPDLDGKANLTYPDSRIMKTRNGYIQGYNGQAVVTEDQIIVVAELVMEENDVRQLNPMVEKAVENLKAASLEEEPLEIKVVLADAGYMSESNLENRKETVEHLIATKKDWKQRKAMKEALPPKGRIPKGFSLRDKMERKLLTKRGRSLYKKRGQMIEAVFGQIKSCRKIDRFMRRGFKACAQEWKLICSTHNLLKIWKKVGMGAA